MSGRRTDRALRRLAVRGAVLMPMPGGGGWAVYPAGDRRRRPVCRLSDAEAGGLLADGAISGDAERRVITAEGRARLLRLNADREAHRAQHRNMADETRTDRCGVRRPVRVNRDESPLGRLFDPAGNPAEQFLTRAEFEAGERFRDDLAQSTLNPRLTMDWSAPPAGRAPRGPARDPAAASDAALFARARINKALDAVGKPLDRTLLDVMWRERGMDEIERAERWPRRSAKLALKLSLQRLGLHYGLIAG